MLIFGEKKTCDIDLLYEIIKIYTSSAPRPSILWSF